MRFTIWLRFFIVILASSAASSASADSPNTPTVADIFARHEAAVGYSLADGKAAPFIAHWTNTWQDMVGSADSATTVVHQAGAIYRTDETYLGATTSAGFDGRAFWHTSANDNTFATTGFMRPFRVTAAVIAAQAFGPTLDAKYLRSTKKWDVVRIHPTDGLEADVYFSRTTSLIDQVQYDPDGYAVWEQLRDYRAEGPVVVAHTVQDYDTTSTLTDFQWNVDYDASELAPNNPHRYLWLPASGSTTVPFDMHGGVIIEGSVNGQDGHFLLDSGTDGIELSRHFATIAGLKLDPSQKAVLAMPKVEGIDVADMHLRDVHVSVVNWNYFEPYDGVLGSDVFARTIVTIDYDKRSVTFQDPTSFHADGTRPSVPIALDGGYPQISVTADDKTTFQVAVASGQDFTAVFSLRYQPTTSYAQGNSIKKLVVGTYTLPNVRASSSGFEPTYSWIPAAPATIGLGVLASFDTTYDYPDHLLYLTPVK